MIKKAGFVFFVFIAFFFLIFVVTSDVFALELCESNGIKTTRDIPFQMSYSDEDFIGIPNKDMLKDLAQLKDLTCLEYLDVYNQGIKGDIGNLGKLTNLRVLSLHTNPEIYGNICSLKAALKLKGLKLAFDEKLYGDISCLKDLNLETFAMTYTKISGDISDLSQMTNLKALYLAGTNVSGDISSLGNLTNLEELGISNDYGDKSKITGDLASLDNLKKLKKALLYNMQITNCEHFTKMHPNIQGGCSKKSLSTLTNTNKLSEKIIGKGEEYKRSFSEGPEKEKSPLVEFLERGSNNKVSERKTEDKNYNSEEKNYINEKENGEKRFSMFPEPIKRLLNLFVSKKRDSSNMQEDGQQQNSINQWKNPSEQKKVPFIKNITGTEEAEEPAFKNNALEKRKTYKAMEEQKEAPPVIKNFGVDFADYNSSTKKAGDFSFSINSRTGKVFGEFGEKVRDGKGGMKALPHYSYFLPKNTPVMAVSDGEVVAVFYNKETRDYEIHVRPFYGSYWDTGYDHIINPAVKEKDKVKAGEAIAYAGDLDYPVEISLEFDKQKPGTFYPLLPYFDSSLKKEYEQKVWKLISDWETYKGNNGIYDESAMTSCAGCLNSFLKNSYNT